MANSDSRLITALCVLLCVQYSVQFWSFKPKNEAKKKLWDELSVKLPGFFGGKYELPMTKMEAKRDGWVSMDGGKCDGNKMFRGNRYRKGNGDGIILLFDSNGRIAGMQIAISTSVAMVKKRRSMVPVADDKYYITVYFNDPKRICNAPARGEKDIGDRFLIQMGPNWNKTMNVPIKEADIGPTSWVRGKCIPFMGTFYWYEISRDMDCESVFPVYVLYSKGKLSSFGLTLKGHVNSQIFDHPNPSLAFMAFDSKTFPRCIANAKTSGSTLLVKLQSKSSYACF